MPNIIVRCPKCHIEGTVPGKFKGRNIQCNRCGTKFLIQEAPASDMPKPAGNRPPFDSEPPLSTIAANPPDQAAVNQEHANASVTSKPSLPIFDETTKPEAIPVPISTNTQSFPSASTMVKQPAVKMAVASQGSHWGTAFSEANSLGVRFANACMPLFKAMNNLTTSSSGCMACCTLGCLGAFVIPIVHYSLKIFEWFTYYTLLLMYWLCFGLWYVLIRGLLPSNR